VRGQQLDPELRHVLLGLRAALGGDGDLRRNGLRLHLPVGAARLRRDLRVQQLDSELRHLVHGVRAALGGDGDLQRDELWLHLRRDHAQELPGGDDLHCVDRVLQQQRLPHHGGRPGGNLRLRDQHLQLQLPVQHEVVHGGGDDDLHPIQRMLHEW
jgi:hypothetical protein